MVALIIMRKLKSSESIVSMGKIATSVLLKMFINSIKRCYTTDAP